MPIRKKRTLFLVYPISASAERSLLARAATVARRRRLDVIVYTPALSTAAPHSETSAAPEAVHEALDRARRHAEAAVEALEAQQVAASFCVESHESVLRGAFDRVRQERPALMMMGADEYVAGTGKALSEGGFLERASVPVWVVHSVRPHRAVLGALELDRSDPESMRLDERIAEEADRAARALDATSHVVHSLSEVPKFVEAALPGVAIDRVQQDREDEHVARAHALAMRHDIAPENVHMQRGEPIEAVAGTAEAVKASVVVLGAAPRGSMSRFLFESKPKRLLDRLRTDLLIVNRTRM